MILIALVGILSRCKGPARMEAGQLGTVAKSHNCFNVNFPDDHGDSRSNSRHHHPFRTLTTTDSSSCSLP